MNPSALRCSCSRATDRRSLIGVGDHHQPGAPLTVQAREGVDAVDHPRVPGGQDAPQLVEDHEVVAHR